MDHVRLRAQQCGGSSDVGVDSRSVVERTERAPLAIEDAEFSTTGSGDSVSAVGTRAKPRLVKRRSARAWDATIGQSIGRRIRAFDALSTLPRRSCYKLEAEAGESTPLSDRLQGKVAPHADAKTRSRSNAGTEGPMPTPVRSAR